MLTYYTEDSPSGELQSVGQPAHFSDIWVHARQVSQSDIIALTDRLQLDGDILHDVCDNDELPHVEFDIDNSAYVFLRFPWVGKSHTIQTTPLLAVTAQGLFVTLTANTAFDPLQVVRQRLRVQTSGAAAQLLLTITYVVSSYETHIRKTDDFIKNMKGRLRSREATNDDFIRFISIEDNLGTYGYNLQGTLETIMRLRDNDGKLLKKRDIEALDDTILHIKQLLATVASLSQSVSSIQTAHATISNNILNQRMKALTVVTLLVTIPNVLYGMYGMNVPLPYQNQPWVYAAIMGGTVFVLFLVFVIAKRSRLF